jgi:hypothetical protein
MSIVKEKPAIAKLLPLPSAVAESLSQHSSDALLASLFFATGLSIDARTNVKDPTPNMLNWFNSRLAIGFIGQNAKEWGNFVTAIAPNAELFSTKNIVPGYSENQLVFSPDNARLMTCDDPQAVQQLLRVSPSQVGKHWRQAMWVSTSFSPPSDIELIKGFLGDVSNLAPANTALSSIAKVVYADLSQEIKNQFISNATGRLWLDNVPTLMLKLTLILHAIEYVESGVMPDRLGEGTVERAGDLAIALKTATFDALGIRF